MDYALEYAQSKKIEYTEARAHSTKNEQLIIKNGVLDTYLSTIDSGFCVKILTDGGLGFASTNKWIKDEARTIVDTAYKFAKMAKRKDKITFAEEKGVEIKWSVEQKKKIEDIQPEEKIEEPQMEEQPLAEEKTEEPQMEERPLAEEKTEEPQIEEQAVAEEKTEEPQIEEQPVAEEKIEEPQTEEQPVAEEKTEEPQIEEQPTAEERTEEPQIEEQSEK